MDSFEDLGLTEDEMVARLGLVETQDVAKRYSLGELLNVLGLHRNRVRAWLHAGLIQPIAQENGTPYFSFSQLACAKTLCDLVDSGVRTYQIRESLERIRTWMPAAKQPLEQLAILESNGQLIVRIEQGLVEPSGQMLFDFGDEENVVLKVQPECASYWYEEGVRFEREGFFKDAVDAYRKAILAGGQDADTCLNLANTLFALGRFGQASERFRQVIEIDPKCGEAWNNLGLTLVRCGCIDEARIALQCAIELDCVDAHFNLADLLDNQGREEEARLHWKAYLGHNARGRHADYAHSKLA